MAKKNSSSKISLASIKTYGPLPRTLMTLVTALVVAATFGTVGWLEMNGSSALTSTSTNQTAVLPPDYHASGITIGQKLFWMWFAVAVVLLITALSLRRKKGR